jgi:hypothetical protein
VILPGVDGPRRSVVSLTADRRPTGAGRDDAPAACVLVETARRLVSADVERLGDRARDERGLRCEIVL